MIYKLLVVLNVLVAAGSQMLLKQGAKKQYPTFWRQYLNPWVVTAYMVLGGTMLVNVFAMSKGVEMKELSIIESLSYLFVPCLSWLFFKERITWRKAVAIGVIMMGVVVFFI